MTSDMTVAIAPKIMNRMLTTLRMPLPGASIFTLLSAVQHCFPQFSMYLFNRFTQIPSNASIFPAITL
jgi:hypothetical protein